MIAVTDRFRESVDAALISVEALHAAIDDLPTEKTIHINVETTGMPEAAAAAAGTGNLGDTGGLGAEAAAARAAGDAANEADADYRLLAEAEDDAAAAAARNAAAMEAERAAASDAAISADEFFAALDKLSPAVREAYAAQEAENGALRDTAAELGPAAESLAEVGLSYREMVEQGILPADSALRGSADAVDATRAAYRDLVDQGIDPVDAAFTAVREHGGGVTEALASAGDAAEAATVPFERVRDDAGALDAVLRDTAASAPGAASGVAAAGNAARDSGNAVRGAYGWWGLLTKEVTLFGGLLGSAHLIGSVQLWHIALDGLFESAVALGEGLAALSVGLAAMAPASEDIYNHLKAVQSVNSALGSSIPPLTGKFQALAQSMAPQVVEAYGGALNLVNQNGGVLAHVAQEVVTGLDDWIAKLDIWHSAQAGMGGMLQNGVGFLHQFEQVLDSVGVAIDNLIKADPGTAHYLMDLVVGFSKVLDVITEIPAPILQAALALHSFMLWGGLLTTGLMKLAAGVVSFGQSLVGAGAGLLNFVNQLGLFGTVGQEAVIPMNDLRTAEAGAALESNSLAGSFVALAASPWTWALLAAAAVVMLAIDITQADHATKSFIANMNNGLASMTASQAIPQISADVGQLNGKLGGVTQSLAAQAPHWNSLSGVIGTAKQALNVLTGTFTDNTMEMNADANAYSGAIVKLTGEQKNLFAETGNLIKQGYTYQQSLALMDLAGVQAGDSLALMKTKVDNLITGYQNMGVQGGMLQNSVNAVTFATEQQSQQDQCADAELDGVHLDGDGRGVGVSSRLSRVFTVSLPRRPGLVLS